MNETFATRFSKIPFIASTRRSFIIFAIQFGAPESVSHKWSVHFVCMFTFMSVFRRTQVYLGSIRFSSIEGHLPTVEGPFLYIYIYCYFIFFRPSSGYGKWKQRDEERRHNERDSATVCARQLNCIHNCIITQCSVPFRAVHRSGKTIFF